MKAIGFFVLAAAATISASVFAQTQPSTSGRSNLAPYVPPAIPYYGGGYGGWWNHSSTVAEGYGRGLANVIRAKGDYNLATSAAAVNFSEARRREIENRSLWTQTYFEMREVNRQQRDAEIKRQRGNPEDYPRYAQAAKPKPLSNRELDAVTGEIHWPVLLTAANYDNQREALAKVFASRAYHGVLKAEDFLSAIRTIDEIAARLSERIKELPPQQFVEARRFLKSLAYEARLPAG
jgi:hypothetical protein